METTYFCAYKYGHFQLSIWIPELLSGICPPEGMWDIFSCAPKTGKEKGFQSKCPSKMGPCTGCLGCCHCNGEGCWGKVHGHELAAVGLMWLCATTAELFRCDEGFCLCEELNVSLYGTMTLWLPRLAFQTPVCAHMCICVHEREWDTHMCTCTHPHLLTQVYVSTQTNSIACEVN